MLLFDTAGECSAKDGTNVKKLFNNLASALPGAEVEATRTVDSSREFELFKAVD